MKISIGAMLNIGTSGASKAAKDTKVLADNMKNAQERAAALDKIMGRTGASAVKRSGGFNDRDGISTRENRGAKGVSGQRGAAGRDFAGLRDASDSTSGIVAAYATAAANMFAITAAFKALADAAKVKQLKEGLELVGAQSGVTLGIVSKNLEKVTGYGISAADSMKSVAAATAAGFSGKEIERLGGVARGAAVALGRDLGDAMDRLTRGSIKLEPELLDELGIMTRIDDAVTVYANSHNKAKTSLTQTERRQAFLNAVLQEGEDKFKSISESVPISSYDKLTAAMKNMSTEGIGNLVDALGPLIDLLTAFPQLMIVPLTGVLQSVVSKLIPAATEQYKKLTVVAKQAGLAAEAAKGHSDNRINNIAESIGQARRRAGDGLGLDVSDSIHLDRLQKEYSLVSARLVLDKEALNLAIKNNVAGSEAIRIAERRVALGIGAKSAYKQAISQTKDDIGYAPGLAQKNAKFTFAERSAAQFDVTQHLLESKSGNPIGMAGTYWKGMGAQINESTKAINTYKTAIAASNIELGLSGNILKWLNMQWVALGLRVQMFGVIGKLAMLAFSQAIPIIGLLVVGWTLLTSAMDFFKSDKQKALEEYNNKLGDVLKTALQVTQEIATFREKGKYGAAFEAEIANAKELLAVLKEGQAIKDRKEGDFGIKNKNVQKGVVASNLDDKNKQALGLLLSRLESFKSPAEFKKLSAEVLAAANAGKDFSSLLEKDVENIAIIEKSWSGIVESSKKGGDAVRKYYGGEAFKTAYSDISDQLRDVGLEIANQQKTIFDPEKRKQAMQTTAENMMKGGREYFLEMDRLLGDSSNTFTRYFDAIAVQQAKVTATLGKTDGKSISDRAKALAEIQRLSSGLTYAYTVNTIAAKGEIENLKVKEQEFRASVAKSALQIQELRNTMRTTDSEIKKTLAAVARSESSNGTDLGQTPALVDAIKAAEVALKNVNEVRGVKEESLRADYALLHAQKEFEYFKQSAANRKEIEDYNRFMRETKNKNTGLINYEKTQYGTREAAIADAERMNAQRRLLDLQKEGLLNDGALVELQIKQLRQAGKQAEANLLAAKEAYRVYLEGETRRHEMVMATITAEKKILDIKTKAMDNALELAKLQKTNAAASARGNFGASIAPDTSLKLDQAEILDTITKASLIESNRVKGYEEERLSLQNIITGFENQMDSGDLAGYAGYQAEADKNRKLLASLDAQEAGLKAENLTQLEIFMARLMGINLSLERLDLAKVIENKLKVVNDKIAVGKSSVIDNAGGWGQEFQSGLEQEASKSEWQDKGGITALLADTKTVNRIRAASQELAALNLVAESTQKISEGFHTELVGAFTAIIDGSKDAGEAFADMALSMLKMIAELIAQLIAMQIVKAAGSALGFPPLPGAGGGIMPMATGGIMSRSAGGLQGVVNKPTYLVGEGRYNEAVVPLPNGRAIPVQMHGGNSSNKNNVQVTVHLNGSGEATKTESAGPDMNNMGELLSQAVIKELQKQKMPGGVLNKYGAA